jgi:double-strand break repair protein MRE11
VFQGFGPSCQGVWEKDEIRKDDSFNTFEEIFQIAVRLEVDLVLLGGDLFHDNKPSRTTLKRTMEILSKYCLNDRPVPFQILSDQKQNFTTGWVACPLLADT